MVLRTEQNPRKRNKWNGDKQSIRVQNIGDKNEGNKIKEEMKVTISEIKENIQGTNSEGEKARIKIKDLEQKEEINIQPEQNEETRIQKNERLRNLRDNFKRSNIWIIGLTEGEEEEQEIENWLEQIMKENFPNLLKEIDFQEVQEAQSPKEVGSKQKHTKTHHNYITRD